MHQLMREIGLNCFPLLPFSKRPKVEWTVYQTKKCDLPIETNYAVVAGKTSNSLFIVDLDTAGLYDDFKDFDTFTVKTGKGYHLYFYAKGEKLPDTVPLKNKAGQKLDIRSEGSYVVGPGSVYEDKKTVYTVVNSNRIKTVDPQIIKERLVKLGFNPEVKRKRMAEVLKGVERGERDDSVFRLGMAMRHSFGLENAELLAYLRHFNQHLIFPPLPDLVIKQKVQSIMSYDIDKIRFKEVLEEADLREITMKNDDKFWPEVEKILKHSGKPMSNLAFRCENCGKKVNLKPDSMDHRGHSITVIY